MLDSLEKLFIQNIWNLA